MSAVIFLNEADPSKVAGLQVGAGITYQDRCNDSRGLVYEVGQMVKVAWTDSPGLSEVPANGISGGWALTGEIESAEAALAARDIALEARTQRAEKANEQRAEVEALKEKGRKVLSEIMPASAKAAVVAALDEDASDIMTDLFQVRQVRTVVLGFSTHTRDIFSEMRKIAKASGFEEVQHLVNGGEDQEHREKYSQGGGYYLKDGERYSSGWTIRKVPLEASYYFDEVALALMQDGGNQLPLGKTIVESKSPPSTNGACTLRENPKFNGIELIFPDDPGAEIRDRMKSVGFRWHRRNQYWYAKDRPAARAVAEEIAGAEPATPERQAETVAKVKQGNADKLRNLADKMTKTIEDKLDPTCGHQNVTHRRARMAASMCEDGEALQRVQSVLYGLADSVEADTLPDDLAGIQSKVVITDILQLANLWRTYPEHKGYLNEESKKRLGKAGVTKSNLESIAGKLEAYIKPPTAEDKQVKTVAKLERELIGLKLEGFFPTPAPVIDQMLIAAGIGDNDSILEPSAGKGDIADEIRERFPDNRLELVELNSQLRSIIEAKGHMLIEWDFLELDEGRTFDRVIMNPPFDNLADIDHVKKAYQHLNDGGRLVALMSESPLFRSDKKAAEFREWLEDVNGYAEKLADGSFKGGESFRQTGVSGRMVVIDK